MIIRWDRRRGWFISRLPGVPRLHPRMLAAQREHHRQDNVSTIGRRILEQRDLFGLRRCGGNLIGSPIGTTVLKSYVSRKRSWLQQSPTFGYNAKSHYKIKTLSIHTRGIYMEADISITFAVCELDPCRICNSEIWLEATTFFLGFSLFPYVRFFYRIV